MRATRANIVDPELRDHFVGLARTWIRLADDPKRTLVVLNAENEEDEPKKRQTG
jgi:hypothetical protein